MPRCKNCQSEITKFDTDICPVCGEPHPIDPNYETIDVTSYIKPQEGYDLYHSKSRKTAALLCLFLGYFGVHDFYLGFQKRGLIELFSSLVLIGGVGSLFFFLNLIPNAFAYLIPFLALWLCYIALSFFYFKKDNLKDGHGEFLR